MRGLEVQYIAMSLLVRNYPEPTKLVVDPTLIEGIYIGHACSYPLLPTLAGLSSVVGWGGRGWL